MTHETPPQGKQTAAEEIQYDRLGTSNPPKGRNKRADIYRRTTQCLTERMWEWMLYGGMMRTAAVRHALDGATDYQEEACMPLITTGLGIRAKVSFLVGPFLDRTAPWISELPELPPGGERGGGPNQEGGAGRAIIQTPRVCRDQGPQLHL